VNVDDAEEYTQALGQVFGGGYRQIALGFRLGVPKALGLSIREWAEERLGGYARLSIPERQKAVWELVGEGMTIRQTADVLGVSKSIVAKDVQKWTAGDGQQAEQTGAVQNWTDSDEPDLAAKRDRLEEFDELIRQGDAQLEPLRDQRPVDALIYLEGALHTARRGLRTMHQYDQTLDGLPLAERVRNLMTEVGELL
jgi:predicted transcriptional regulator